MICCKIIADYNSDSGNFSKLLQLLGQCGDFLWTDNALFFSNVDDFDFTEKQIVKILRKANYPQYFINIYSKKNQPSENEEVNAWLLNKLMRINYQMYERESQEAFRDISHGLDLLNDEIEKIQLETEARGDNGGEENNGSAEETRASEEN